LVTTLLLLIIKQAYLNAISNFLANIMSYNAPTLILSRYHMNFNHAIKNTFFTLLLITSSALSATELPNPELMGSDGKKHHLKDFLGKGKWTTMIVWGPKCPACIEEMPEIQSMYDDRANNNINVLGLAIDYPSFTLADIKQVKQFEEDYFVDFPNLIISSNIYSKLGLGRLQGTPTIILVDPKGKVSAVQLGGVPASVIEKHIASEDTKAKLISKK
jgi:thiol-disulfide isomerase/thioredoxin